MHELLPRLAVDGTCWRHQVRILFGGQGSLGNGAAMRIAPLGAWFSDDLGRAAEVTHAHPEGIAGAVAVSLAADLAAGSRDQPCPQPEEFLHEVAELTPKGAVRDGLHRAAELPAASAAWQAADLLGNGQRIRADDTVPFALWSAAWHLDDLVDALWSTAEGLGDVDTTCAITGGVVAARTGVGAVPQQWLDRCEPLPDGVSQDRGS